MGGIVAALMALLLLVVPPAAAPQTPDDADTIFSGTAEAVTAEKLTVSREILGNPAEHMTFALLPETKIEGKLQEGVRVTVKFRPTDDGPVAETVIVRESLKPKKKG